MGSNIIKLDITKYNVEECTHLLKCSHKTGANGVINYFMKCIVLGELKSGNKKIVVFGDRNYKGRDNLRQVKYVKSERLVKND